MSNRDHEEQLRRAISGDRDALTDLLEQTGHDLRDRLHGQIARQWQAVLDLDDVLQVTFLEVFLRISQFEYRGSGSFEAWVMRVAKNNLVDAVRALEQAKQLPPDKRVTFENEVNSSWALLEVLGVTSGTPSRKAVTQEMHVMLRKEISQLPRDYAQVLTLYDLEGKTAEQVAEIMRRSKGAVYMLRSRALDCLRELWGSESQFG